MKLIKYLSVFMITCVIVMGLSFPIVIQPQTWYEFPFIQGLEEKARNIFFHVPVAWTSVLGFIIAFFYGIKYLQTKNIDHDIKSASSAGLGLVFCLLSTLTGSIWAKFNWGSFWNWDPRQTSIFILLLIYGAYFALRSAINSDEMRAQLSSVYAILAGLAAPFFVFIMPRIVSGLHPGAKGDDSGAIPVLQLSMPANMLIVFFAGIIGFSLLFIWLLEMRIRLSRIENKLINK